MRNITINSLDQQKQAVVKRVIEAALRAADPEEAVKRSLRREGNRLIVAGEVLELDAFNRVRVIGVGKASISMARGLVEVLGDRLQSGLIISKHTDGADQLPKSIAVCLGGHPVPGENSAASTAELVNLLADSQADDLVLCLISGGGSALMTWPQKGTSLVEMQELTRLLLACGADIGEMNTLRKHLDRVKGGGLARLVYPARLVTLILSDVIGSPLDVIASGPTVADSSTFQQAREILQKYHLMDQAPAGIRDILERGCRGEIEETVKEGDPLLGKVTNLVIASNLQAATAALEQARQEGLLSMLLTTYLQGEAAEVGRALASVLLQIHASGQPLARPACIVAGGETTVTIHGTGRGGRNQELALGAALLLDGTPDVALVTLGTDGEDGPTDAAGAVATGRTAARASASGISLLDALQNNDSYHCFQALGDLVITGPTGTNVNDLVLLFAF